MSATTLQDLVSSAASEHPDRVAVTYDSGDLMSRSPVSLTYREVVDLSAELSRVLRSHCADGTGVIGLYCTDDLFIPVWILGILQSPAAYVPLDPASPGLLSVRVMSQCSLQLCVVQSELLQRFQTAVHDHMSVDVCVVLARLKLTLVCVTLSRVTDGKPAKSAPAVGKEAGHKDLAYVLHTSGTTGTPKTVRVPHKCILPNILHLRSLFQMKADDVVFLASPLTFDPSVVDLFLALSTGARLLIIPSVIKKMPKRLNRLLFEFHKTTVLQVTPTLLCRFGPVVLQQDVLSRGSPLRVLVLGGEACPSPALLSSWKHKDNKTHIFNIYGITEVSCWACCYQVPQSLLRSPGEVRSVPLGTALTDTLVDVRDEHGVSVTEGEGQVFIGGENRVCLLDDEDNVVPGTMRATGDWVKVEDGQMLFLSRTDRRVKRHGKRVDLDVLQQLIVSVPQVDACAVALHQGVQLLAFAVASASGAQTAAVPPAPSPPTAARRRVDPPGQTSPADADLSRRIMERLSALLPSHCVPDTLLLVPALSLTPHGKVDMEALMKIYNGQRRGLESPSGDVNKVRETLQSLWKDALGFPEDVTVGEESNFLLSGGDSLKALQLRERLLSSTGGEESPQLLEVLLDGSFSDVLRCVAGAAPLANGKRERSPDAAVVPAKREDKGRRQREGGGFRVVRRGGEVMEADRKREERKAETPPPPPLAKRSVPALSLSWSSDTGRCVDASPALLVRERRGRRAGESRALVFIGSHSHRVQALELEGGDVLWERVLGDRVEASAAVSRCGTLVIVGCYDGCVYFLCAASGQTRWTFETGDAVKSSAAVDPHTGAVMVGSHDGFVYALNPQRQQCVWKRDCGGGAVFSSPRLHPSLRQLLVASLGGRLLCLHPDSGDVLWSVGGDVPFFSSPNCSSGRVVIGSVNGNICCYSDTGTPLWQFLTKGPVFSSPCFTPDGQRLLCGSHDGRLYCLNCADGSLAWSFQTSGKVYATPCVLDGSTVDRQGALVAVASTDGTVWILDAESGHVLTSHALPGQLFSSPVVDGRSLVIGCRNDYVYCLRLTTKEEGTRD